MGIKEWHISQNTKNIKMNLEVKNFSDVGYWLRDLKQKLKKFDILKINIILKVSYFDDGIIRENRYLD